MIAFILIRGALIGTGVFFGYRRARPAFAGMKRDTSGVNMMPGWMMGAPAEAEQAGGEASDATPFSTPNRHGATGPACSSSELGGSAGDGGGENV